MKNTNYRYMERRNKMIHRVSIWVGEVVGVIFLAWVIIYFCLQFLIVQGDSMLPSYGDRDLVLVNKLDYRIHEPKRLDPVVIKMENGTQTRYIVKRIVACPGETLQIQSGAVYINGKKTDCGFQEDILSAGLASYAITLGEDEYFVMGDNCNNSEDSRVANIGNIGRSQFLGKVVAVIKKGEERSGD